MKIINLGTVLLCLFLLHKCQAAQQQVTVERKESKAASCDNKSSSSTNVTWKRMAVVRPTWVGTREKDFSEREKLLRAKIVGKLNVVDGTFDVKENVQDKDEIKTVVRQKTLKTTALHVAIDRGDERNIKLLIEKNPSLIDSVDVAGRRPVVMLVTGYNGQTWVLRVLMEMLKKRPYLVDTIMEEGNKYYTLLQWSVTKQYEDLCRVLLDCGAKVDASVYNMRYTPLHYACACGNYDMFQLLVRAGADPNATDFCLATPLHYAAGKPWFDASERERAFFVRPSSGASNEQAAAYRKQGKIRRLMIRALVAVGADMFAADAYGKQPIEYACEYNHLRTSSLLFELEAANREATAVCTPTVEKN
jgi:ankyrin repeat protein